MRTRHSTLVLTMALLIAAPIVAAAGDGSLPMGRAAQRVSVDPATGEISPGTKPSASSGLRSADEAAFRTSHEGLREAPSPVVGGGMTVDLQDRFRSALVVRIHEDGPASLAHEHRPTGQEAR